MAYPFPNIKIKVYPKTFLKDVHISLFFPEVPISDNLQKNASEFFNREFGLPNIQMEPMPKAVSIFSNEKEICFAFGLSRADLSIKREAYRSFEEIKPLLNMLFGFLQTLGLQNITAIAFSKYNELEYETKDGVTVADVMVDVFSKELLKSMTKRDIATQKDLSRWEKVVQAKGNDETDSLFTIEYGFKKIPVEKGRSSLTLKTIIESRSGNVTTTDLFDLMVYYNQILDNAFHWCVTDQILKAMRED